MKLESQKDDRIHFDLFAFISVSAQQNNNLGFNPQLLSQKLKRRLSQWLAWKRRRHRGISYLFRTCFAKLMYGIVWERRHEGQFDGCRSREVRWATEALPTALGALEDSAERVCTLELSRRCPAKFP